MRAKDKTPIIKVGIFLTFLTIVFMIMVISIGKEHAVFESKVNLKAVVDTAATLKPGAFVELRGIRVGVVDNIKIIDFDKI